MGKNMLIILNACNDNKKKIKKNMKTNQIEVLTMHAL